jgi:hypothetical protein
MALPSLARMREVLRVGMSKAEFFQACDDLMDELGGLKLSSPGVTENLVGIYVAEGGQLLCFLSDEKGLSYVEYEGDVFLE